MTQPAKNRPTKKQKEVLTFVENYIQGNGFGPSYREIRSGLGYKSVATVALHIDSLVLKGHLQKNFHKARSLELVESPDKPKPRSVQPSDEKWLLEEIEVRFSEAEERTRPTKKQIDNLYVLLGTLKILGIEEHYKKFLKRLKKLEK